MKNLLAVIVLAGALLYGGAMLAGAVKDTNQQWTRRTWIEQTERTERVRIREEQHTERVWIREQGATERAAQRQETVMLFLVAIAGFFVLTFLYFVLIARDDRQRMYLPPPRPELPSVPPGFHVIGDYSRERERQR